MKSIILKSTSPRRKELLGKMGYNFEIKSFDVDETMDDSLSPYDNVKRLGLLKASINKDEDYGKILIGCDTIVVLDNKIFGKPHSESDAINMLEALNGKKHQVMSGVGVIYKDKIYNFVEVSNVYFKKLSHDEILAYVSCGECYGKAGSYAIQGIGRALIDHIDGSLNNIIGLPTEKLKNVLEEIYGMED